MGLEPVSGLTIFNLCVPGKVLYILPKVLICIRISLSSAVVGLLELWRFVSGFHDIAQAGKSDRSRPRPTEELCKMRRPYYKTGLYHGQT